MPVLPAHPEFLSAFASGLVNGPLPPGLSAVAADETASRFAVYRNNVAVGLCDALAKRFPVIERLVGPEFFRAMARVFVAAHPPRSPVLIEWGGAFPGFLAGFAPVAGYPYMADVARIEIARGRAYHAADAESLAAGRLMAGAAAPESLILHLHASVQVLHLAHPAVTIWASNQPGAALQAMPSAGPQIALILRDRQFAVPVACIGAGDAALISALQAGLPLLAAAEAAQAADQDHIAQDILVRLMQAGVLISPQSAPQKELP